MPALLTILIPLLAQFAPALGELVVAFLKNLTARLESDPDAMVAFAYEVVRGIEENPANAQLSNEEKHQMAFDAILLNRPSLSHSLINTVIELSVQRLKS